MPGEDVPPVGQTKLKYSERSAKEAVIFAAANQIAEVFRTVRDAGTNFTATVIPCQEKDSFLEWMRRQALDLARHRSCPITDLFTCA